MQRWAGATDTAVGYQRVVVNPMLEADFLDISARLTPQDKAHSRFLAALQLALDPELGRASPGGTAESRPPSPIRRRGIRWRRRCAPGNGWHGRPSSAPVEVIGRRREENVLAQKVVRWWRQEPHTLDPVAAMDFVSEKWLEDMLAGRVEPRPSSVGFLTNLIVAVGAPRDAGTRIADSHRVPFRPG